MHTSREQALHRFNPVRSYKVELFYRVIFVVGAASAIPAGLLLSLVSFGAPAGSATLMGVIGFAFFAIGLGFLCVPLIPKLDLRPDRIGLNTLLGYRTMLRSDIDYYELDQGFRAGRVVFYPKDVSNGRSLTVRTWFATGPDLRDWVSGLPSKPPMCDRPMSTPYRG